MLTEKCKQKYIVPQANALQFFFFMIYVMKTKMCSIPKKIPKIKVLQKLKIFQI